LDTARTLLVVHPHFHSRRTGVTRHVETVVPALGQELEAFCLPKGCVFAPQVPQISWRTLWRRSGFEHVVWHAHRNLELLAGLLLRLFRRKVRVAYTRHSSTRAGRYTRFLARRADLRFSLTRQVATAFGLPSVIVPHGVDLERFSPPKDRTTAWTGLGLGGKRGLGVIGRIRESKGQGDFVRAVTPLLKDFPEWVPVLVGKTQPEDARFLGGLMGLADGALRVPGEQSDPVPWYHGLTICVQPSHAEAYSLALLEAMACGCCVVASRLPNMEQVIDDGRTGFLYEVGNADQLRTILARLMRTPNEAERVGAAAAASARDCHGIDLEAQALASAYRDLWKMPRKN
jgi:mannosyltransferase